MNRDGLIIERTLERKSNVRNSSPIRHTIERKIGAVADQLSRRNLITARCELCNEALETLVELCFERDGTGQLCNVDPISGQVLIGMPTGWRSHSKYGLRRTEALILRYALLKWSKEEQPEPLFLYDELAKKWFVCVWNYPGFRMARRWLDVKQITPSLWNEWAKQ